jgi:hypothetical protein
MAGGFYSKEVPLAAEALHTVTTVTFLPLERRDRIRPSNSLHGRTIVVT